jgi:hypothetical protein
MKRLVLNYGLLALAGVFSFLCALNIRVIVLMIYRTMTTDPMMLAGSLVNAATVIIAMLLWLI